MASCVCGKCRWLTDRNWSNLIEHATFGFACNVLTYLLTCAMNAFRTGERDFRDISGQGMSQFSTPRWCRVIVHNKTFQEMNAICERKVPFRAAAMQNIAARKRIDDTWWWWVNYKLRSKVGYNDGETIWGEDRHVLRHVSQRSGSDHC